MWLVTVASACSGGPGGEGALQPTAQEKLPASHADAGESDEDGERRAGGHAGPPAAAEERLASLAAEGGGAQGGHGEAGGRAEVKEVLTFATLRPNAAVMSRRPHAA